MTSILDTLATCIWTYLAIPILTLVSVYMTLYYRGVQFHLKRMFRSLFSKRTSEHDISAFQSLTMSLAARVGVGSLSGVALAIYIGGPGSIFWMWFGALITAAASFAESTLAQIYKQKKGTLFVGGPAYYIENGIGKKSFGMLYAIVIILTYTFGFTAIQANTISTSLRDVISLSPVLCGIMLVCLTAIIIFGGTTAIAKTTEKLVPVMAISYLALGLIVILTNLNYVPTFFQEIFNSAFGLQEFSAGAIGIAISTGFKRGIFSSEAGMGSGAHAAATTNSFHPTDQGYIQSLGVYITIFVISTITAFLIMITQAYTIGTPESNGIEMTQYALSVLFGPIGSYFLSLAIFFFAFSTILTGYFYGESNLNYLSSSTKALQLMRLLTLLTILVAANGSASLIWSLVDIGVAITAIINVYAIFLLSRQVKRTLR